MSTPRKLIILSCKLRINKKYYKSKTIFLVIIIDSNYMSTGLKRMKVMMINRKLQSRTNEIKSCSIASFMTGCWFQFFRRHSIFEPDVFSDGSGIFGTGLSKNFARGSQPSRNKSSVFFWKKKLPLTFQTRSRWAGIFLVTFWICLL